MILPVIVVLAACSSGDAGRGTTTTFERAVERLVAASIPTTGAPWGVAVDDDTVWVSDASRGTLLEVDAGSGEVLGELPTGAGDPRDTGLAVGGGQLWVANLGGTVAVIDTATRQVVARLPTGSGEPAAVALDERWAWLPTHGPGGGLVRIDRFDLAREPMQIQLAESGFAAATGGGTVWVAGLDGQIFAVDAASGRVEQTINVGGSPRGVTIAAGDVWVSLRDERAVVRLDAATGREVARIDTGGPPWPIAADRDVVWTATLDGDVLRIDPSQNAVTGRAAGPPEARGIGIGAEAVWVASQSGALTRVPTR